MSYDFTVFSSETGKISVSNFKSRAYLIMLINETAGIFGLILIM